MLRILVTIAEGPNQTSQGNVTNIRDAPETKKQIRSYSVTNLLPRNCPTQSEIIQQLRKGAIECRQCQVFEQLTCALGDTFTQLEYEGGRHQRIRQC